MLTETVQLKHAERRGSGGYGCWFWQTHSWQLSGG